MRQVVPGVWRVHFSASNVNAYAIVDGATATVVDAGPQGGHKRMLKALARAGAERLESIVLTHAHADHAGGAADLAEATGATILLNPLEALSAASGRPGPPPVSSGERGDLLARILSGAATKEFRPFEAETLADGDRVGDLEAITTPGHSPGHTSLLASSRGVLFTGDAAWNVRGIGTTPLNVDHERARHSLAALGGRRYSAACFGHGAPIRRNAIALIREAAARQPRR